MLGYYGQRHPYFRRRGFVKNIDKLITKVTGVPAQIADDPMFCVARGTGIVLENLDTYKRNVLAKDENCLSA